MITILAEKPSVAKDIAKVLGVKNREDGFLSGNGYAITWAFGHLVSLANPSVYTNNEKWNLEELPIIPDIFTLIGPKDSGAKKQLKCISKLFNNSSQIINATDAGREGELIFRYIYDYCKTDKLVKRLWISDMTEESIRNGFNNLQDSTKYDNLYYSARARSESDWLIGINATRYLTLKVSNSKGVYSVGRVQTATLRLIVERYLNNINFESKPFYVPYLEMLIGEELLKLKFKGKFDSDKDSFEILELISNLKESILKKEIKKETERAPLLYDLTSLQRDCNKRFGLTAQQTLDIAQSLYQNHKILSYPRTDSRYLSENQFQDIQTIYNSHKEFVDVKSFPEKNIDGNKAFNNSKISDHHAIIPTKEKPRLSNLKDLEKKVYLLVLYRFYERFSENCIKNKTIISTEVQSHIFHTSGIEILIPGWKVFNGVSNDDILPQVEDKTSYSVNKFGNDIGKTTPPALFTEASLLQAMETAGKEVEEEEMAEALKDKGIGTPATRASIIEVLLKREYIERRKKQIIPKEIGIELIKALSDVSISKVGFTGDLEYNLKKMEKGGISYNNYMDSIKKYTTQLLPEMDRAVLSLKNTNDKIEASTPKITCPKCKKGAIRRNDKNKVLYCSEYKNGCDFSLWENVAKKKISEKQLYTLLENGQTGLIKGFKSKTNKSFNARLKLNKETYKIEFLFDEKVVAPSLKVKCPKCSGELRKGSNGTIYCSNYKKTNCDFVLWESIAGRKLSDKEFEMLLNNKKTGLINGFKSKKGKAFSAFLILKEVLNTETNDVQFKVEFEFEQN